MNVEELSEVHKGEEDNVVSIDIQAHGDFRNREETEVL